MKFIFTFSLFLLFSFSFAQDVSIVKSDIFKTKKKVSYLAFSLESENGEIIIVRSYHAGMLQKLKGYYIQHFDSNLKLKKELEYEVKDKTIRNAFLKDNKLHFIEIGEQKKEKQLSIGVNSLNLNSYDFEYKNLMSISEENVKDYFGVMIFPFFISNGLNQADRDHMGEVTFSHNKKFFAINFDIKNKDKETHKVFVFNDNFELVYDKLIQKNIQDKLFEYADFQVDGKDGAIYFLGKVFEKGSRRSKKDGKPNYHFELFKVNANNENKISFKNDSKYINSLSLLRNHDKLTCIGFFGNKDEGRLNGVCVYDLNPKTLEINHNKFNNFSEKFLTDKYGDKRNKKKRKKENGINHLDFKGVYLMANNDIIINAEEFYITTHSSMNANGGWTTSTTYHFNDIISVRLDGDGNLKWDRNINKAQTSLKTSSFTSLPVGESTYFVINCSDKISKTKNGRVYFPQTSSKKSNLFVIKVDEKGNVEYKKLIDDKDSKVYYMVNNGIPNLNNKTIFLQGVKKKNRRIVRLQFN